MATQTRASIMGHTLPEANQYPTVLAHFAAAQVRAGRSVGSRLNANDVSSRPI